ncbi:MAG: hypothetical protein M3Z03_08635 [Actinomycetota bacterium]|nr:hypothetical protein [Actinomycetota bacterium]
MAVGLVRSGAVVGICCCLLAPGCSSDDGAGAAAIATSASVTTSTAPPRPTTTTSLVYDPATVEGQVEAAYLRSWEVYAAAVYDLVLDEEALASVYADPYLQTIRGHIQSKIAENRPSMFRMDHDYTIQFSRPGLAVVIDNETNHHVRVDPVTRQPIEADPNQALTEAIVLEETGDGWRVTRFYIF